MGLPTGVREIKDRYKVVPASNLDTLSEGLNTAATEGYKALFTVETQDGHVAVIMEHE